MADTLHVTPKLVKVPTEVITGWLALVTESAVVALVAVTAVVALVAVAAEPAFVAYAALATVPVTPIRMLLLAPVPVMAILLPAEKFSTPDVVLAVSMVPLALLLLNALATAAVIPVSRLPLPWKYPAWILPVVVITFEPNTAIKLLTLAFEYVADRPVS